MKKFKPGILILILGIILFVVFVVGMASGTLSSLLSPNHKKIPGDPSSFDPVNQYEDIRKFIKDDDLQLYRIKATYVKSDGTLDMKAEYMPKVEYEFFKKNKKIKKKKMPVGVEKNKEIPYVFVKVEIVKPFTYESWSNADGSNSGRLYLGMYKHKYKYSALHRYESVKAPEYSFKYIWDKVNMYDTPNDAVAVIDYSSRGYEFEISSTNIEYDFDLNGNLID